MDKPISLKHQRFIDEYLRCWNGTQAYLRVFPNVTRGTAKSKACILLAREDINSELVDRMNEVHMSADEALEILAAHARGDVVQLMNKAGDIDLLMAQKNGLTRLIKKFKQKKVTLVSGKQVQEVELELHDAQAAVEKILKIHGKFVDRHDVTSNGENLLPSIVRIGVDIDKL